jgi:hypothetical protein
LTSSLFLKTQSQNKSKITEVLQNNLPPPYHYLIDMLEQMTMVDKEQRPTIKQILKTEMMKNSQKDISHFEIHLADCPHCEITELKPVYGTINIKKLPTPLNSSINDE